MARSETAFDPTSELFGMARVEKEDLPRFGATHEATRGTAAFVVKTRGLGGVLGGALSGALLA